MAKGNESMEAAVEELEKINQSPEERYLYLRQQMAISDEATQKNYWTKVGEERAATRIKKAEDTVVEAETKVAEAEAKAESNVKEEKIKIATQLIGKLSIDIIAETVGLSVEELNELKQ